MKIRIGIPLPNDVDPVPKCTESIRKLIDSYPHHEFEVVQMHSSFIAGNRNEIIKYRDNDYKALLFVDGDISFEPEDFEKLMSSELPIIAGYYTMRNGEPSAWTYDEQFNKTYVEIDGRLKQTECTAAGFLFMEKWPLKRIQKKWFCYPETDEDVLTEDVGFCFRCKESNIPIYVDTSCKVKHWRKEGNSYVEI